MLASLAAGDVPVLLLDVLEPEELDVLLLEEPPPDELMPEELLVDEPLLDELAPDELLVLPLLLPALSTPEVPELAAVLSTATPPHALNARHAAAAAAVSSFEVRVWNMNAGQPLLNDERH